MRNSYALAAVALVCGLAVGWMARDRRDPPPPPAEVPEILAGTIHVQRVMHRGSPTTVYTLRPYSVSVGPNLTRLRTPPADEQAVQLWAINFDGGRVWVYAEQVD